jgi:tetratricopeptide (TPR) repeat protein
VKRFYKISVIIVLTLLVNSNFFAQDTEEQQLIEIAKKESNPSKKLLRLIALGEYYQKHNIYKADSLKEVIHQLSIGKSDFHKYKAMLFEAEIFKIQGNQQAYLESVIALQPYLNGDLNNNQKYRIRYHLGSYYSHLLDFVKSKENLNIALKLAKKLRNNTFISQTYSAIAKNHMYSNVKDSAFYYTDISIQYARRSANKSVLSESFNCQSIIYAYFDQIELSVAKNFLSLQLASSVNDLPKLANYTREIGQSQLLIFNLVEAEKYFKQSIDYSRRLNDNHQLALAYSNLGTVYKERKLYTKAIQLNEKAIILLEKIKDYNGLGDARNNLGIIYKEQQKYELASQNFNQALVLYESTNNKERIAGVYHNVGSVFKQQKKYLIALNYLNRSIAIRKQFGSKNLIFYTYRIVSDVYKEIGEKELALKYIDMYISFLDSNTSLQKSTKIAELSELYRSEQRERLIALQADSIERQKQERSWTSTKLENTMLKNRQKTYIILGFILLIILGGIILFYRLKQNSIKQQQKEAEMLQTLLRSQMNPHFIFNSMSVIQSYIYDNDIKNSSKFLVSFSRLIRLILENSSKEFISIETEIEILHKYLETQKLRFEDRFEYLVEVSEELTQEKALIPPMITQPFIENAIEHGQLHTVEGGFIRVLFSKNKKENMLQVEIIDNGIGRKASISNQKSKAHRSMAISITTERIKNLNNKYKSTGSLNIEDYDKNLETGTKVLISLPYQFDK